MDLPIEQSTDPAIYGSIDLPIQRFYRLSDLPIEQSIDPSIYRSSDVQIQGTAYPAIYRSIDL